MPRIRIAACQINPTVGDLDGNAQKIIEALDEAEAAGADVAVLPELSITGYPPEDLLLKPGFVRHNEEVLQEIAARTKRCVAVVGFVDAAIDLHNAAAVCAFGKVQGVYRKRLLPNYAVFDEARYFTPGNEPHRLYEVAGVRMGVSICEDIWSPTGPMSEQAAGGAELILNLNASPFYAGRLAEREKMLATRAADASCGLVYVNQIGGQDELVFDGCSMLFDSNGHLVARAPQFEETVMVVDLEVRPNFRKRLLDPRGRVAAVELPRVTITSEPCADEDRREPGLTPPLERCEEIYKALVVGTRDYVEKNGFTDVVLGLSGGIDSSLVTVIAADAVGPERVHCVALPSRYSTEHSITDAEKLCANLGIELRTIAIEPAYAATLEMLQPSFEGTEFDVTEENLQGRIRANVLMALANKFRSWLVLICGNKSELAVGYTTIYGVDMAGGFAVIKDVPKTLVYELAEWRNRSAGREVIPVDVLTKPPSAELRPDQKDTDSLPSYDILDPIVQGYVEQDLTANELIELGHDADLVRRVVRMIDVAEWKRRQSPVGVRVTSKAFGRDRRVPITNGYR
ncbi:MAG TPA: NAD+ synthase [Acidimicrobiales bacterium]|jgi:NAD+ synthase (glutamine-hydrolysing)|nr:NAD+ synthase [Acidimicrobiales bacterium]